jgi:hypothetical protein
MTSMQYHVVEYYTWKSNTLCTFHSHFNQHKYLCGTEPGASEWEACTELSKLFPPNDCVMEWFRNN